MCLVFTACFPNNAKHRMYTQITEGVSLAAGIGLLAVSSTQADCDMDIGLGMPRQDCKSKAGLISGVGLTMILLGLVGFAATTTTAVDDSENIKAGTATPTPTTTPGAGPVTPTPATRLILPY